MIMLTSGKIVINNFVNAALFSSDYHGAIMRQFELEEFFFITQEQILKNLNFIFL